MPFEAIPWRLLWCYWAIFDHQPAINPTSEIRITDHVEGRRAAILVEMAILGPGLDNSIEEARRN